MNNPRSRGAFGAAVFFLTATAAASHAVLQQSEAHANAPYRAVVQIMHGCKGAPTTAVKVTIPEGATGARALVKPGWTIDTQRGPYAETSGGARGVASDGVKEITWSGGSVPSDEFDEFVFTVRLAGDLASGSTLYFPVLQTCTTGAYNWAETPTGGQDVHALAEPAPGVRIVAAATPGEGSAVAPVKVGTLTIEQPWIRATPARGESGGAATSRSPTPGARPIA